MCKRNSLSQKEESGCSVGLDYFDGNGYVCLLGLDIMVDLNGHQVAFDMDVRCNESWCAGVFELHFRTIIPTNEEGLVPAIKIIASRDALGPHIRSP